jgi:mRNA interferase RelE/StbE
MARPFICVVDTGITSTELKCKLFGDRTWLIIFYFRQAERYLKKGCLENDQIRILEALDTLISDSTKLDIKPLYGRDELRLRVGKYRLLFFEDRDNNLYVITTIKPHSNVC